MPPSSIEFVPSRIERTSMPSFEEALRRAGPVQAVLVCLAKPLAGMGTTRQLQGIVAGLEEMRDAHPMVLGYIGPQIDGFGDILKHPMAAIQPAASVALSYQRAVAAFESAFGTLAEEGIDRIAVLSMGYTAYGPESIKRAIASMEEKRGPSAPKRVVVGLIDSAYPDTDREERDLDDEGWPISRFHAPAYQSDDRVKTLFLLTSAYAYESVLLGARAPKGLAGVSVIVPPYTEPYLDALGRDAWTGHKDGLGELAKRLPGMGALKESDLIIPVVSSDIWSKAAVGVWMTPDEHHTCMQGTASAIRALAEVSRRLHKRIFVPMDTTGAQAIADMALEGVAVPETSGAIDSRASVVLSPYRGLSQTEHSRLLGAAHLAISRTGGQANATVVLTFAGTPNVVIDMPDLGYMQSALTSLFMTHKVCIDEAGGVTCSARSKPLAWRARWHFDPSDMAAIFEEALTSGEERDRRTDNALAAFKQLKDSPTGNIFSIVEQLVR